jgi:hypothetical protein
MPNQFLGVLMHTVAISGLSPAPAFLSWETPCLNGEFRLSSERFKLPTF